ncbi:MAG: two-component system sensor histidine kinase BarA [Granulosicoccus sp.]|jgi:two-component system sensor histidine kinase BarA
MPQAPYTMKHYCLLNICFLATSAIACLFIYDTVAEFSRASGAQANDLALFVYQLIVIVLGSSIVFSILSWACLFCTYLPRKFIPKWALDSRQKNIQKETVSITNINIADAIKEALQTSPIEPKKNHDSTDNDIPIRLLIVDDNPANIMIMTNHLRADNREIVTATNGLDAIQLFEKTPADIIFMDIEMEGMNGPQTLQNIRSLEKLNGINHAVRTPIIAVSAHKEIDKKIDMLRQGFDDYLAKPIDSEKLNSTLQRWQTAHKKTISHALFFPTPTYQKTHIKENVQENILEGRPISPTHHRPQQPHKLTSKNTDIKDDSPLKKVVSIESSLAHSNNNSHLAKDMLALLIIMIKKEKIGIITLCNKQDWEKLYQLNHKIYGGSSYCGVPQLQSANKALERLLQSQLTLAQPETNVIEQAVNDLSKAIDDIILWDEQHDIDIIFGIN